MRCQIRFNRLPIRIPCRENERQIQLVLPYVPHWGDVPRDGRKQGIHVEGTWIMRREDYELIRVISNDAFPLYDFVYDIGRLFELGRLEGFDYQAMQEDLIKIAKLFKYYHDEAEKWHDKYIKASAYEADALRTIPNVLAKAEAFEILKKRFGIGLDRINHVILANPKPLLLAKDQIKIKEAMKGE